MTEKKTGKEASVWLRIGGGEEYPVKPIHDAEFSLGDFSEQVPSYRVPSCYRHPSAPVTSRIARDSETKQFGVAWYCDACGQRLDS